MTQHIHSDTLITAMREREEAHMGRAYDYDAPQVEAWAAWTLQTPPDSPDNDIQLGVGACDTFPPLSGQHSDTEERMAAMRRHVIRRDNGWELMRWAYNKIAGATP